MKYWKITNPFINMKGSVNIIFISSISSLEGGKVSQNCQDLIESLLYI